MTYSIIMSVTLFVAGGLITWIGVAGRSGSLKPNGLLGLRTAKTMSSEAAWMTAHKVAAPLLILGGAGSLLGAVMALISSESSAALIAMAATGWTLAWIIVAMARINKAIA